MWSRDRERSEGNNRGPRGGNAPKPSLGQGNVKELLNYIQSV